VTLPTDSSGCAGADVVIPITVDSVDGVLSMDLEFTYDPAVLQATAVFRTPLTGAFTMASDLGAPGRVDVSMSGTTPLTGAGDVGWVVFRTLGTPGAGTDLVWVQHSLNGGAIVTAGNDGRVDLISSMVSLSVPDDVVATTGTDVIVPIVADPAAGVGSNVTVEFNPDVLSYVSATKTPISQGHSLTVNGATPGVLRFALFGTTPLSGAGSIIDITFLVVGADGEASPLNLTRGEIDEGAITTCLDDGLVRVCDVPPPEVTSVEVDNVAGTTVSWADLGPGLRYDVASGYFADLRADSGVDSAQCEAGDTAATSHDDPRPDPLAGEGYYFLVRSRNDCTHGTYGRATTEKERVPVAPCP
jgi:hypothetical protein